MKTKLTILFILLILVKLSFGQITITGTVLNEEDWKGLPGVWINEVGTTNTVTADLNGDYKIIVSDTTSFLEFSFIGFLTRKVPINGQTVINTSLKTYTIYEAWDQKIGLYALSGIRKTPLGARFEFRTPIVSPFAIKFQLNYLTDFDRNKKIDVNFSLSQYRFQIGPNTWLYGYVDFNYRKLRIQNCIDMLSYSVENHARLYNHNIILGLGKISYSPENLDKHSEYGLIAGYKKEIPKLDFLSLTYKMGFYKDKFVYFFQMDKRFKRVKTFMTYNKIGDYEEIMLGVGFELTYFFKYQKDALKYTTQ
ncbi:carboxypeptidase-like regulatory domain-containing protein [Marinifilum sp. D714]|uniref:carboxypeptidase-like regulatory domain-containing protein n=1 Tax=Marinifilum sp. D714 TaxID=2937523 RepID=UPI0027BD3F07|nr:carboxypeptidase-like regulatory domain-containing protein [Marinifilum sp. D714]MDQ2180405.1 carboxypeptidase-like regulatory domain-containing protein [Marinifilum sp. D714]